jgi:membrane protease subunit HflK
MRRGRIGLLLALVAWLATGIAPIRPEERAVVRRFGAVVARPEPGLWIGFPWGIDRVDRLPAKSVIPLAVGFGTDTEPGTGQFLTGDQNLVTIRLTVEYTIDERAGELESSLVHRDRVDVMLARNVEAATAEWLAARTVDAALLTGRAAIPAHLQSVLPRRLESSRLGILLQRVSVESLGPPEEVREAFDQVNQAQASIRTQEYQAEQDAGRRMREAEATRFRLGQEALSYRQSQIAQAQAEAEAFLKRLVQYRKLKPSNPEILTSIWWDETGRILLGMKGKGRIDLLDQHLGANGLDISQFLTPRKK